MDYQQMRREIDTKGYTIVRGLLTPDEVDYYIGRMEALSGITRSGMTRGGDAWKGTGRGSGGGHHDMLPPPVHRVSLTPHQPALFHAVQQAGDDGAVHAQ